MLFSIVIPTYRRHNALLDCLNCLSYYFQPSFQACLGYQIEALVSDDAHDAFLKDILACSYPWVSYYEGPARGPAANRNNGALHARGDWIVFTDDDCLPQPGWLEAYSAFVGNFDILVGRTSGLGTRTRADEECPINEDGRYLWSCNFAIKRNIYLAHNGFNENFPGAAMEDVEFNERLLKSCVLRHYVPNAAVLHPWRRRKGLRYAKQHSLSIGLFVKLHPEFVHYYCFSRQILTLSRLFKRSFIQAVTSGIYIGLFRQLFLDFYSVIITWIAVNFYDRVRFKS